MSILPIIKNKKIFIYGAGVRSRYLNEQLSDFGFSIEGHLVSTMDGNPDRINEIKVFCAEEIIKTINNNREYLIIIAVGESYKGEIEQYLRMNNVQNYIYADLDTIRELVREVKPFKYGNIFDLTSPLCDNYGFSRGIPIDRYYIEKFLEAESKNLSDIKSTIEVGEDIYTKKYFYHSNQENKILDYPKMDLTKMKTLQPSSYDLFVCTQTFNFIFDVKKAIEGSFYLLKQGGTLLATVGGNVSVGSKGAFQGIASYGHFWGFTYMGIRNLVCDVFGEGNVDIYPYGNLNAAIGFLSGLSIEDYPQNIDLDTVDERFSILIGIRAKK